MSYIIRKGDPTTTGGTVTQGNGMLDVYGKPGTLIGMIATCPVCDPGQGPIEPVGPRNAELNGVDVAIHGDIVACGCPRGANTVIATQQDALGKY